LCFFAADFARCVYIIIFRAILDSLVFVDHYHLGNNYDLRQAYYFAYLLFVSAISRQIVIHSAGPSLFVGAAFIHSILEWLAYSALL